MYIPSPRRHAPRYIHPSQEEACRKRVAFSLRLLLPLAGILLFAALSGMFLKDLSSRIAVSDASDIVTSQVNRVIAEIMRQGDYDAEYFVSLEKNDQGEIVAVSSNMARINALSAQILENVIGSTENRVLTVSIPVGNLSGISLLMGRGPSVPVQIIMLTSSRVEFSNSVLTAGINQTKHQINLQVLVDIDVLVPWGTESAQVVTDVLIADTMVVGQVPDTYLNLQ